MGSLAKNTSHSFENEDMQLGLTQTANIVIFVNHPVAKRAFRSLKFRTKFLKGILKAYEAEDILKR